MAAPLLELSGIDKRFGAAHANRAVDLRLDHGEILGLLGENGAGKTTLMNILFGLYAADAGTIRIAGQPVRIRHPADSLAHGIGMVHQHFHLVDRMTVLENLLIGQPGRRGRLDRAGALAKLASLGERYGLRLAPERLVETLTVGEQQRLEIMKALYRGARILILDEPTSVLTPSEADGLFRALRAMAAEGVGVIYISHKLAELRALVSRVVVLRQGRVVGDLALTEAVTDQQLARLMCGQDLAAPTRTARAPGPTLLELQGIGAAARGRHGVALDDISFSLAAGEILGIAGVSGNGQRELAQLIAGLVPPRRGRLLVAGQVLRRPTPRQLRRLGVAVIPEDRLGEGLIAGAPLADSLALARFHEPPFSRHGVLRLAAMAEFAAAQIAAFDVRSASPGGRTGALSGGNLQKALLARELAFGPRLLIAAQPTRGLDVAAQAFVHSRLLELCRQGGAVLLISEDLDELSALSDRIAVMHGGRIVGILPVAEADRTRLGLMMAGQAAAA